MKRFPFFSAKTGAIVLRVSVALLLATHGVFRLSIWGVPDFGAYLGGEGFPFGTAIALAITLFEIIGGFAMAAGYFVRWIALVFMAELLMGIIMVHAPNGWFVVGYTSGGAEYSTLLIICLLVIAAFDNDNPIKQKN